MAYFFWTAMPWVFSTMHYYMSLVLPSQSVLLFVDLSSLYIIHFSPPLLDSVNELTIIRRVWAKYRDLSVVSRDQLFASAERQIIDPLTTDKSWSFAINTEFNNNIVLSFGHRVGFQWTSSGSCHFHARAVARRRKAWFDLRMSRMLFAAKHKAKHRWTTLRMSRPLFVGSYLQVTWWAFGQWLWEFSMWPDSFALPRTFRELTTNSVNILD